VDEGTYLWAEKILFRETAWKEDWKHPAGITSGDIPFRIVQTVLQLLCCVNAFMFQVRFTPISIGVQSCAVKIFDW
jgi:hypothetical protein